jgi:hypothetical protein
MLVGSSGSNGAPPAWNTGSAGGASDSSGMPAARAIGYTTCARVTVEAPVVEVAG